MQYLMSLFRVLTSAGGVSRQVAALDQKIIRLRKEALHASETFKRHNSRLERMQAELMSEISKVLSIAENADRANFKLMEALEATQEQLRTANDITIPTLVAAHQLVMRRIEAEVAVQSARAVLAAPMRDDQ